MRAPWRPALLLCLVYVSASKLIFDVYNYMTSSNPTLLATMVNEREQDLWEPEPNEEYFRFTQVLPSTLATPLPVSNDYPVIGHGDCKIR